MNALPPKLSPMSDPNSDIFASVVEQVAFKGAQSRQSVFPTVRKMSRAKTLKQGSFFYGVGDLIMLPVKILQVFMKLLDHLPVIIGGVVAIVLIIQIFKYMNARKSAAI